MGFLDKLAIRRRKKFIEKIDYGITQVKHGVYLRLERRFRDVYGEVDAGMIAAAITNELFSEKALTDTAVEYAKNNRAQIKKEIEALKSDDEIKRAVSDTLNVKMTVLYNTLSSGSQVKDIGQPINNLRKMGLFAPGESKLGSKEFQYMAEKFYSKGLKGK